MNGFGGARSQELQHGDPIVLTDDLVRGDIQASFFPVDAANARTRPRFQQNIMEVGHVHKAAHESAATALFKGVV
jgi:hypothetical protein